jgi:hypothetical protein
MLSEDDVDAGLATARLSLSDFLWDRRRGKTPEKAKQPTRRPDTALASLTLEVESVRRNLAGLLRQTPPSKRDEISKLLARYDRLLHELKSPR